MFVAVFDSLSHGVRDLCAGGRRGRGVRRQARAGLHPPRQPVPGGTGPRHQGALPYSTQPTVLYPTLAYPTLHAVRDLCAAGATRTALKD